MRSRGKEGKEGEPMRGGASEQPKRLPLWGIYRDTRTTVSQNRPPLLPGVTCIISFAGKKIGGE